jgi:drug/metabolite transporter (DMT)-like permease
MLSAVLYALISAICNVINSLSSSFYTRSKLINSETASIISIFPSFLLCTMISWNFTNQINFNLFLVLCFKNIIYGFGFYLRYQGFERLGAFNGALMAAMQPILISVLSLIILGEYLSYIQWIAIAMIFFAIIMPIGLDKIDIYTLTKFVALPSIMFCISTIFDRYLLVNHFHPLEFFVWDKISVLPAVFISIVLAGRIKNINFPKSHTIGATIAIILGLSVSWGIASFTYALALAGEKTAIITLVRNLAFPATAVLGGFLFREKVTVRQYISLVIVVTAIFLGIEYK